MCACHSLSRPCLSLPAIHHLVTQTPRRIHTHAHTDSHTHINIPLSLFSLPTGVTGSPSSPEDEDYSDSDFEEKRKRAEAGQVLDSTSPLLPTSGSPALSALPAEPVPSLEESEPEVQQGLLNPQDEVSGSPSLSPSSPASRSPPSFGSGNFRRAGRYFKPKFLMKASMKNVRPDRVRKASWHKEPAPDFCYEAILVHEECDSHIQSLRNHKQNLKKENERWSFNLEDGNCYQYHDPCPLFKRNSFTSLSQCLATCWRHATPASPFIG